MRTTSRIGSWAGVCVAIVLSLSLGVAVGAQTAPHQSRVTFNSAVVVPGAQLPAGTYVFKVSAERTIAVSDSNGRVLTTFHVVPATRTGNDPAIVFNEAAPGVAPQVDKWFESGLTGYQMVYNKTDAAAVKAHNQK